MAVETFLTLPRWLYIGVAVGLLASASVAAVFVVAGRLFPERDDSGDGWGTTEERRRAEIRRYLEAIGERFAEDASVAGESVAFYLPQRDVAVTFDARTFLALERTPTYGILMEHELPGAGLGHRLPFETPATEFDRDDGTGADEADAAGRSGRVRQRLSQSDPAEAAYEVLELPSGAGEDAIRRAYRERVKEVHPDHGGDEAEFRRVREAYDTARRHAR